MVPLVRRVIESTPVVFGYSGDPVEAGLVNSFSRPGGNFTGATFMSLRAECEAGRTIARGVSARQALGDIVQSIASGGAQRAERIREGRREARYRAFLCSNAVGR